MNRRNARALARAVLSTALACAAPCVAQTQHADTEAAGPPRGSPPAAPPSIAQRYARGSFSLFGGASIQNPADSRYGPTTSVFFDQRARVVVKGATLDFGLGASWQHEVDFLVGSVNSYVVSPVAALGYTFAASDQVTMTMEVEYALAWNRLQLGASYDWISQIVAIAIPLTVHLGAHAVVESYVELGAHYEAQPPYASYSSGAYFATGERLGIAF